LSDVPESASGPEAFEVGDPVCWLHLVCESCGALLEHEDDPHRPGCNAEELRGGTLPTR
jgi:hypothetical protein